ncbi:FkbM family methyltransferase [Herbiconiux sp. P15]|uniref:FkbM family methyltransferase n=1 Tax=Herbiconiux liukaitaii TaxID=3342799 RepID=UPI0035B8A55E
MSSRPAPAPVEEEALTPPLPVFEPQGPDEPVTWVRANGIEVLVPAEDKVVTPYMERKHDWDGSLLSAILDCLSPRSVFLDVGAFVGYISAAAAKRMPQGTVIAVEPSTPSLELAALNLGGFRNTIVLQGAISNSPELTWEVVTDGTNRGNTRVEVGAAASTTQTMTVQTCTLGSAIRYYGCDVVKIDVQGMEKDVLESLDLDDDTLPNDLTLFCEITPEMWTSETDILATIDRFRAAGFDAYFLTETNAYSYVSPARLSRRVEVSSRWADHFELMLTRGRYAATIRGRS